MKIQLVPFIFASSFPTVIFTFLDMSTDSMLNLSTLWRMCSLQGLTTQYQKGSKHYSSMKSKLWRFFFKLNFGPCKIYTGICK